MLKLFYISKEGKVGIRKDKGDSIEVVLWEKNGEDAEKQNLLKTGRIVNIEAEKVFLSII